MAKHKFEKGKSGNPAGRKKGVPNKVTQTMRETYLKVFEDLQNHEIANLATQAQMDPKFFYSLSSKLLPTEIKGSLDVEITHKHFIILSNGQKFEY